MASATQPIGEGDTRVVKESSDSGVEFEQAAESVATANGSALRRTVKLTCKLAKRARLEAALRPQSLWPDSPATMRGSPKAIVQASPRSAGAGCTRCNRVGEPCRGCRISEFPLSP